MNSYCKALPAIIVCLSAFIFSPRALRAQAGNSGTISGTVTDPSGASIAKATVTIRNPVSGYVRTDITDNSGDFRFVNVPFNSYHLTVTVTGFTPHVQDVQVNSVIPINLDLRLAIETASTTVEVKTSAEDLVHTVPITETSISRTLIKEIPLESQSSSLSSLVTLASPGVAADSNGLFHGLGDHAENSFSIDGQPITDQQSKVFSNQLPSSTISSLKVIEGAPPAQYGDKTDLIIVADTRSGLGVTRPHGDVALSYGSFGSSKLSFDLEAGTQKFGNFLDVSGLNTGRFLDAPEFAVMHDKGNQENIFDGIDYQLHPGNRIHLDLGYTRSWFQNPDSFENLNVGVTDPSGNLVGPTDQRSQIRTFNIAPSWTMLINPDTALTLGGWVRQDRYNYYPSGNPFADLSALNLQRESVGQSRRLTNVGTKLSLSYSKGSNNLLLGTQYEQTFLTENDTLGVVDYTLNSPCVTTNSNPATTSYEPFVPVAGFTNPSQCAAAGYQQNVASNPNAPSNLGETWFPFFNPVLLPYDLTRSQVLPGGAAPFAFNGRADVKELALYVEDTLRYHGWSFDLGIRGDLYNGLVVDRLAEPRLGVSYDVRKTNTIFRFSYARTMETPFNENLVLSNNGCFSPVISALIPCVPAPLYPGHRNYYQAGFEQAFGRYLVIDGMYEWTYTHRSYDFSILGNTPITFPIEWTQSKVPGFAIRATVPIFHGVSAFFNAAHFAARFFPPQAGGLGVTVGQSGGVFRIDHDENYEQTVHLQYQPKKNLPWIGFNWRYDSGLVAGAAPCYGLNSFNTCPQSTTLNGQPAVEMIGNGAPFTPDEEFQAGFFCGSVHATPTSPLPFVCPISQFGSTLINIPAPGTENDDHNPPRIAPRSLFDLSVGDDNLFHNDKYRWSAQFTVINLADNVALYNFLSTFSGTHYVTPRTFTGQIGFHF